jgi:hypothetical protein
MFCRIAKQQRLTDGTPALASVEQAMSKRLAHGSGPKGI